MTTCDTGDVGGSTERLSSPLGATVAGVQAVEIGEQNVTRKYGICHSKTTTTASKQKPSGLQENALASCCANALRKLMWNPKRGPLFATVPFQGPPFQLHVSSAILRVCLGLAAAPGSPRSAAPACTSAQALEPQAPGRWLHLPSTNLSLHLKARNKQAPNEL